MRRIIEFLGTAAAAWLAVGSIRLAIYVVDSLGLWLACVAAACVFSLFAVLMVAELVAATVRQQAS